MPALASVFYLRLVDFSRKPVAEQARLRSRLESAVGVALGPVPESERVVLEAADGFILVLLADPAGALSAAETCLAVSRDLPLCVGGNHGPVAFAEGEADAGLAGDGIRAASMAASFAGPGHMLLTADFREALSEQAPDRSLELREAGRFSDASIRTHELYRSDPAQGRRRNARLLGIAAACGIALLAAGLTLRGTVPSLGLFAAPGTVVFEIAPGGDVFVDGKPRGASPPLAQLELRPGRHEIEVRRDDATPHRITVDLQPGARVDVRHVFAPPAVVNFDVTPGGDVFVDGTPRGAAPALERLELRPGPHTIEIRHPEFRPFIKRLELKSGEQVAVRHVFAPPAVLVLNISPGGNIFLDGEPKGSVADVRLLEVDAGRHILEVRHADFRPLRMDLTLEPGEQVDINHKFDSNTPVELFRKFRKKLGW